MTPRGRAARGIAGIAFLGLAAAVVALHLPAGLAGLLIASVPAWFGISHLVAAATGYHGCPELGAIPTVVLRRPVATNCDVWHRIDRAIRAGRTSGAS